MDDTMKDTFDKASAFQNMWMDSMAGMARVWSQYSPENPPPEELKKIRQGMLNVISQSWEEFMRTPQFMEMMKDSLNNAMTWQGFAKDGANRMHDTMQTPSKADMEGILLSLRHVEKRLLDRMETIEGQVDSISVKLGVNGKTAGVSPTDAQFQKTVLAKLSELEKSIAAGKGTVASTGAKKRTAVKKSAAKRVSRKTTRKS